MSLDTISGFIPILEFMNTPLPMFLTTLSLASVPFLVVKLSVILSYKDFFLWQTSQGNARLLRNSEETLYDFIVVGGGSGGSPVAARLAESFKVLLIEAGGDPHPLTYIPTMAYPLFDQPMIDWQLSTVELNRSGYIWANQKMKWPRGKSLGGCSNSNLMVYMRGNPKDFNRWAEHSGDDRWNYDNVQEVFKIMEDYNGHWEGSAHHGIGGPMHIEKAGYTPSSEYFLEAGKEIGKRIIDPNAFQEEGFFPFDVSQKKGVRFSTFRGYIEPNLRNKNLTIHRYSLATKIHFNDEMRAVGVTYFRHAIKQYAKATKEIIVSSGAINSPKLLMLSGIGPKEHLNSLGIKSLVDLPVGDNLQDHVMTFAGPYLLDKNVSFILTRDITPVSAAQYLSSGKGPFSTAGGIIATALVASSMGSKNWPDILITNLGLGIYEDMGKELEQFFGIKHGPFDSYLKYNVNNDSNFPSLAVAMPESRGFIRLKDKNPFSSPIIDPRYFSDEGGKDLQVMIEAINFITNLYENTTTYKKLGARLAPNHFPGCEKFELKSLAYWECYIRINTFTLFHPAGTCAMGKPDDKNTVVDSELRVLGTKGLRIADASIMPFITNANLNTPTIMIGELCADFIKNAWKISSQDIGLGDEYTNNTVRSL